MSRSELVLTLVGGPTVLVEYGGLRLLTDPTFDPRGLYQETSVRFEKTSGPAIPVEEIGRIDAVLLSHDQHFDNLDTSGRAFLRTVGTTFTTRASAERLGGNSRGLRPFETCSVTAANGDRLSPRPRRVTARSASSGFLARWSASLSAGRGRAISSM